MNKIMMFFTCDVESSLGNFGTLNSPVFKPWSVDSLIWGRSSTENPINNNISSEWGIGLIIDQLEKYGLKGTFFLSALEHHFHGEKALSEIANYIEDSGHEVAAHIHCAWCGFLKGGDYDYSEKLYKKDNIKDHDKKEQFEYLYEVVECIERWTGKKPVSFRAGNFGADNITLKLLSELGLKIDSSRNAALNSLHGVDTINAACEINGLIEIPVTTFEAVHFPTQKLRFVDPSNVTLTEMRSVLDQLAEQDIATLVLVSHSFQYVYPGHAHIKYYQPRPHIVERVDKILELLASDPRVESYTMRNAAEMGIAKLARKDGLPKNPQWMTLTRLLQSMRDSLP
jgi:hypothetical protein